MLVPVHKRVRRLQSLQTLSGSKPAASKSTLMTTTTSFIRLRYCRASRSGGILDLICKLESFQLQVRLVIEFQAEHVIGTGAGGPFRDVITTVEYDFLRSHTGHFQKTEKYFFKQRSFVNSRGMVELALILEAFCVAHDIIPWPQLHPLILLWSMRQADLGRCPTLTIFREFLTELLEVLRELEKWEIEVRDQPVDTDTLKPTDIEASIEHYHTTVSVEDCQSIFNQIWPKRLSSTNI